LNGQIRINHDGNHGMQDPSISGSRLSGDVGYPLVMTNIAIENCHLLWIFPLNMVIFHSYVNVYQRVSFIQKFESADSWSMLIRLIKLEISGSNMIQPYGSFSLFFVFSALHLFQKKNGEILRISWDIILWVNGWFSHLLAY
jgi:hypothetical protein